MNGFAQALIGDKTSGIFSSTGIKASFTRQTDRGLSDHTFAWSPRRLPGPDGRGIILILLLGSLAVTLLSIFLLYRVALVENVSRLSESARTQARLIEAVARFDSKFSHDDHPEGSWGATYSQILDALNARGHDLGSEMGIVRMKGERIVMTTRFSQAPAREVALPEGSLLFRAMATGLSGQSGIYIGEVGGGRHQLMAYEPVSAMGLVVLVAVPMGKIRNPFMRMAFWVAGLGVLFMLCGLAVTFWWSHQLNSRFEAGEQMMRILLESTNEALVVLDGEVRVGTLNPAAERILGVSAKNSIGLPWQGLFESLDVPTEGDEISRKRSSFNRTFTAKVRGQGGATSSVEVDMFQFDHVGGNLRTLKVREAPLPANPPSLPASSHESDLAVENTVDSSWREHTLVARVRGQIIASLSTGDAAVKIIAPKMGMSVRTLQRLLGEEGTSFSDVLSQARQEVCLRYMEEGHLSLDEIAGSLGYSDLTNFHRAFKRWTGMTPARYRRRAALLTVRTEGMKGGGESCTV